MHELADIISTTERGVFFGGAGVSTESGVPDFRSDTTRKRALTEFGYEPEVLLSAPFFYTHPEIFYRYLHDVLLVPGAKPNPAHRALAEWERRGHLRGVVTQNIDGLHQAAGSKNVWELHGTLFESYCLECGREVPTEFALAQLDDGVPVPLCGCGGLLKPKVVLYEEALPDAALYASVESISDADTLIVGGTSLAVYPAAALTNQFEGDNFVIVNLQPTDADVLADLVVYEPIGKLFDEVERLLQRRATM